MEQTKAVQDVYVGAPLIHQLSPFPVTETSMVSLGTLTSSMEYSLGTTELLNKPLKSCLFVCF